MVPEGPVSEGTYVVKKGDTLWGIAKGLLDDPFLWPQIWERNPFITNPNRIFPGDTLAVPGQELVLQVPAPKAEAPKPEPPKETPKEAPREAPREEAKAPAPAAAPPPLVAPQVAAAVPPPIAPASEMAIACYPLLLAEGAVEAAGIGSIVKSDEGRQLLSQEDTVVIGLDRGQTPNVGDRLAVIRGGLRVVHPWQSKALGRALNTLGVLEVVEVLGRTVNARIIYSCDAMAVGDRVGPLVLSPFPEGRIARPTTRQIEGVVVDSQRRIQLMGIQSVAYLDVGKNQGVSPGDVFAVYRLIAPKANLATRQVFPIPAERLGEVVIVRVADNASTAVISASAREIQAGDQAVLSREIGP